MVLICSIYLSIGTIRAYRINLSTTVGRSEVLAPFVLTIRLADLLRHDSVRTYARILKFHPLFLPRKAYRRAGYFFSKTRFAYGGAMKTKLKMI